MTSEINVVFHEDERERDERERDERERPAELPINESENINKNTEEKVLNFFIGISKEVPEVYRLLKKSIKNLEYISIGIYKGTSECGTRNNSPKNIFILSLPDGETSLPDMYKIHNFVMSNVLSLDKIYFLNQLSSDTLLLSANKYLEQFLISLNNVRVISFRFPPFIEPLILNLHFTGKTLSENEFRITNENIYVFRRNQLAMYINYLMNESVEENSIYVPSIETINCKDIGVLFSKHYNKPLKILDKENDHIFTINISSQKNIKNPRDIAMLVGL